MTLLARLSPLLAAALGCLAFLPALGAGFVNWDDEVSFLKNPDYRGLGPAQLRFMLTTTLLGHWSPLAWLTWSVNYALGGLDPWGYHLASLLLHAANIALLCLVARRLLAAGFGAPRTSGPVAAGAVVAALAFGLHPLRAESVAWVSERRDVLCGLFALLAALAYLRGVAGGGRIERRWWALSVLAFAGALLSKAFAMTLPLVLLLLDAYPLRRQALGWRALLVEKLPYAALAASAAAVAIIARQEGGNLTDYGRYGAAARVALAGFTFWFYPWKSVWPTRLAAMYELPARVELAEWRFLGPLLAALLVTAALVALRRRWPAGLAAWASCAIVVAPISGLVHSGNQLAADRYSYLAGLGLAVLAGAAVTWGLLRGGEPGRAWAVPATAAVAGAVLVALGAAAWAQSATWTDSETLWRRALQVDPACSICESNLGRVIARPGRLEEALAHVQRAIALRPDRPGPHENMGVILLAQGRHAEAETEFRRVVLLRPDHGPSRNNLGALLAGQGRDAEAEAELREAARLSPRLADAPANLGALYERQGRHAEAIPPLRRALALDPARAGARLTLARALRLRAIELVGESDLPGAGQLWQEAAPLAAEEPELLRELGRALVEQGRAAEAIPSLERAVTLAPRAPEERFWLARAYRLAGRAAEAERETAALRELAPQLAAELGR